MAGISGFDAVVKVNTGTPASPVYTTVAGQRGATLNMSISTIDITSKDSDGWEEALLNLKSWSIEFDALVVESNAAYQTLRDIFLSANPSAVLVQLVTADGTTYSGSALLTEFPHNLPYDDAETYKVTLKGTGPLTKS